jgi:uncharacterized membrane protein YhaH (DUF805 family)
VSDTFDRADTAESAGISDIAVATDTELEPTRSSRLSNWLVAIVFAILSAYPLFEGISNLIALPSYYDEIGIGGAVPWWLLILGVVAPVILFTAAVLLGRGCELFARALILAVGLAASNALTFSVIQWASALQPAVK